jgi:hypothetical protein
MKNNKLQGRPRRATSHIRISLPEKANLKIHANHFGVSLTSLLEKILQKYFRDCDGGIGSYVFERDEIDY